MDTAEVFDPARGLTIYLEGGREPPESFGRYWYPDGPPGTDFEVADMGLRTLSAFGFHLMRTYDARQPYQASKSIYYR